VAFYSRENACFGAIQWWGGELSTGKCLLNTGFAPTFEQQGRGDEEPGRLWRIAKPPAQASASSQNGPHAIGNRSAVA
jgi:hypothetical protein